MTHDEALTLRSATGSDVGRQRDGNEDAAYATTRLYAVADGMGGHAAGEVASAQAIAAMRDLDARLTEPDLSGTDLDAELAAAVADAAERLDRQVGEDPALSGMGTTLTAMLWAPPRFSLAHIGDSRCYRLRGDTLTQLTRDHTMVQTLVDQGRMSPELAERHPSRSVLVRALLAGVPAEPDVAGYTAEPGDTYLLCSDGLTDVVPVERIGSVLASAADPDDAVSSLIDLANDAGGPDNITCVVLRVAAGG
ncbi:PP2C family protein-serine/threonine phosphatase [Saccharomonospora iraqiensis]|uniref:PP2C family protein-serine/threonine phosphatase n=1 Tax=Saccharomonospora iraqiensis TaxID=52698 RepID=UPI0004108D87|nr:protein phosphatase 2C domain-containing protein [Saccharomonospora iraqiensis]